MAEQTQKSKQKANSNKQTQHAGTILRLHVFLFSKAVWHTHRASCRCVDALEDIMLQDGVDIFQCIFEDAGVGARRWGSATI